MHSISAYVTTVIVTTENVISCQQFAVAVRHFFPFLLRVHETNGKRMD